MDVVAMIVIPDMRDGYVEIVRHIIDVGRHVAPRGEPTLEVPDVVIKLLEPSNSLPIGVGRKINLAIAAAEAIQIVGGVSIPSLLLSVAPQFQRYMDDGEFWGGYGARIGPQLVLAAQKLKVDPDTRQAVITLWDPKRDNVPGKHDYPCTLSLTFQIRDDLLELHTTMRSNDVWLGLAYDVFQFTQLQLTMAAALDVAVGPYFHHAVSLHIYGRDLEAADGLHEYVDPAVPGQVPTPPTGFGRGAPFDSIFAAQRRARRIAEGRYEQVRHMTPSEQWYLTQLRRHIDATSTS